MADRALPQVWVLLGEGAGGNAQMRALADALGWPFEVKQLRYNRLNHLPNPVIGARAFALDRRRSASLAPPWPDLVIAASRRSAPIARWIKAQSGRRTRLVHLLHTQAPLHHFDLVVTLPQFCLPERPNVLHNTLPLNRIPEAALTSARARWQSAWAHLPRPWIGVLVGGNSSSYRLDTDTARRLGAQASAQARAARGSLLISTSKRTPAAAATALLEYVDVPHHAYCWRADDPDNPYIGFLALADAFIVTADSASLPAEACATGRPVTLFSWQPRRRRRRFLRLPFRRALIYWGLVKPTRDFAAFHGALRRQGLVDADPPLHDPPDDLQRTVDRIKSLMKRSDLPDSRRAMNSKPEDSPCHT